MIPKIIHQTWKSRALPDRFARWAASYRQHLPGWEYRLWDDEACLSLVRESYPRHVATYLGLENAAARADLFRYMVLHRFGGLYADIDSECRRPIDFVEPEDEFVVGLELDTTSKKVMQLIRSDLPKLYCQWAFLAQPGHPILHNLIEEITRDRHTALGGDAMTEVLKRTGPHAFTRVILKYLESKSGPVKVVPPSYFGAYEGRNSFLLGVTFLFPELFRKVYIRHHFEMSWVDRKTKQAMFRRNLFLLRDRKTAPPKA